MVCNWGVLGAGFIANRAMIPAIQQSSNARVLALASRDEQRGREVVQRYRVERLYSDYEALLADPGVQVVYIALPNSLHREWAIRAAHAGKHVLCEKPLALNVAECDEIISTCHSLKVLLMEAVMYRFHPRMQALKHMIAAGEVGPVARELIGVERRALVLEHVGAVPEELARGRVHRDRDVLAGPVGEAGEFRRGQHHLLHRRGEQVVPHHTQPHPGGPGQRSLQAGERVVERGRGAGT